MHYSKKIMNLISIIIPLDACRLCIRFDYANLYNQALYPGLIPNKPPALTWLDSATLYSRMYSVFVLMLDYHVFSLKTKMSWQYYKCISESMSVIYCNVKQSISGAIRHGVRRLASPTLYRYLRRSPRTSLHARPFPIIESRGSPLCRLLSLSSPRFSLTDKTRCAESASRILVPYPFSWSWRW